MCGCGATSIGRPALIVSSEAAAWRVEWNAPIRSQRRVGTATLLRFDGIDEPLLLIPLGAIAKAPASRPLAASRAWALIALERESDAGPAIRDLARWRAGLSASALVRRELAGRTPAL